MLHSKEDISIVKQVVHNNKSILLDDLLDFCVKQSHDYDLILDTILQLEHDGVLEFVVQEARK